LRYYDFFVTPPRFELGTPTLKV